MKQLIALLVLFTFLSCNSDENPDTPPDSAGQIKLVKRIFNDDVELLFEYDGEGQRTSMIILEEGDEYVETYTYNSNGEIENYSFNDSRCEGTCILQSYSSTQAVYSCQEVNTSIPFTENYTLTYVFDGVLFKNRIVENENPSSGSSETLLRHDSQGRLISQTRNSFDSDGDVVSTRTFNYSNWDEGYEPTPAAHIGDGILFPGHIMSTSNPLSSTSDAGASCETTYEYDEDGYVTIVKSGEGEDLLFVEYFE